MHCMLTRPLFDGKASVIFDSELCKEGFMRIMDPDFGVRLCFCLSLGIIFLPAFPSHLLFLSIPLIIFSFAFTQHRFVRLHSYLAKSEIFNLQHVFNYVFQKTDFFLLICVVKEQRYWKEETVLVYTENPNKPTF